MQSSVAKYFMKVRFQMTRVCKQGDATVIPSPAAKAYQGAWKPASQRVGEMTCTMRYA